MYTYSSQQDNLMRQRVNTAADEITCAIDYAAWQMKRERWKLEDATKYVFDEALKNLTISPEPNRRERVRCKIEAYLKELAEEYNPDYRIDIIDKLVEGLLEDGGLI